MIARLRHGDLLGGRYEVEEMIGVGRFARVWSAQDKTVGITVAAKVLRAEFAEDEDQREHFKREAHLLAQCATSYVIRPTDLDVDGARPYIIMRNVKGESLRARLLDAEDRPLELDISYGILDQLLAGLAHIHSKKIVHRDLKPENILLEKVEKAHRVVIIDVGLACGHTENAPRLTRHGNVPGTPTAMAPEQFLEPEAPPAYAIDVHAVGLIAHEMLSGEHYNEGLSAEEIAARCAAGHRPALLTETPRGKHLGVAPAVSQVVAKALSLNPENRQVDAGNLRDELQAALKVDPANLEPGSLFDGGYEIREQLGQGGMGSVYRAWSRDSKREVALKVLSVAPERTDNEKDTASKRFRRERRILMDLRHPRIARIYDGGEVDGNPYYVLELVEGRHFAPAAADLGWPGIVRAVEQLASALTHAADEGVIHRDIKSPNILIDAEGNAKLVDFGIARVAGSDMTAADRGMGTPGYQAPELIRDARTVTGATDQWGLAAVVHEALTGEPPGGRPARGYRGANTLLRQMQPLTEREGIPTSVAEVLDRALSPIPEERYATTVAFAAALAATADEPVGRTAVARSAAAASTRNLNAPEQTPFAAAAVTTDNVPPLAARRKHTPLIGAALIVAAGGAVAAFTMFGSSTKQSERTRTHREAPIVAVATPKAPADAGSMASAPEDAATVRRAEKLVKVRVETWEGSTQRKGVAFVIDGTRYVSPATIEVVAASHIAARIKSRRFQGTARWVATEDGTKKMVLSRRRSSKTTTKAKKSPEIPIEPIEVIHYDEQPRKPTP